MPTDLVVLAADKNIEYGLRGLLSRPQALDIRPITSKTYVHPQRDPACARKAHEFLRQFAADFQHALVVFDHQGSGCEGFTPADLEAEVQKQLAVNGWRDRARAIVIAPELEAWVFSSSPQVEICLQWNATLPLKAWLEGKGLWSQGQLKPADPKAALESALTALRRPRSSAIYEQLARTVGLTECQDASFGRLKSTLQHWFPEPTE